MRSYENCEVVRALPDGRVLLGQGTGFTVASGHMTRLVVFHPATRQFVEVKSKDVNRLTGQVESTPAGEIVGIEQTTGIDATTIVHRFTVDGRLARKLIAPGAVHASASRDGSTSVLLPRRIATFDAEGRCVSETFCDESIDRRFELTPLAGFGFPSKAFAENTAAYRIKQLKSANPLERRLAAVVLAELGPKAVAAAAALREAKLDKDELVRKLAERALGAVGDERLQQILSDAETEDFEGRIRGITALNDYRESSEAASFLLNSLNHREARIRAQAANILGGFEGDTNRVLPALVRVSEDNDAYVRQLAVHSIGRFGKEAAKHVCQLRKRILDEDKGVAAWTLIAISKTGPIEDEALYQLILEQIASKRHQDVRSMAIVAAGNCRGTRTQLTKMLIDVYPTLSSKSMNATWQVRETCLICLSGFSPDKDVDAFMLDVLKSDQEAPECRVIAARRLAKSNRQAVIPVLKSMSGTEAAIRCQNEIERLLSEIATRTSD